MSGSAPAILWYRRDLRVHDHPALHAALAEHSGLVCVFVLDRRLLGGRFASRARTEFMLGCLRELDHDLRRRGGGLVIRHGEPERVLPALARELGAGAVFWTTDVAPFARARDRRVTAALREGGVAARPHGGNYVADISLPRTGGGDPYRVFTPFHRAWSRLPRSVPRPAPVTLPPLPRALDRGAIPGIAAELGVSAGAPVLAPVVPPGERAARLASEEWLARGIGGYAESHDRIGEAGTSRLSPYIRWGCLSVRELEATASAQGGPGTDAWIRQLCWREFYAHVLLMWPGNLHQEFQERYRGLEWDDDFDHLLAWQQGRTGYPAVDAGMRELAATGWMHNRARLIVGSFLTKDLHLDWRAGERWFEAQLLDGEPAQNNGNWQWIASVGVDPAPPSRRLFNPTRQGARFDPEGSYVRRWVPELEAVPAERLWEPWTMTEAEQRRCGCRIGRDYPSPVVDHAHERRVALARFGAGAPGSARTDDSG